MADDEYLNKKKRLAAFLDKNGLDGVVLQRRNNFAWITGGRDNHIANNTSTGVAAILATKDQRICLANTIESPRMKNEELAGMDIDVVTFPWWDRKATAITIIEVMADRKIAADIDTFGLDLPPLPGSFNELRWSLTEEEISRYRDGGRRAAQAMEMACASIRYGDSEFEVAGTLDYHIHQMGCNPLVTLVAADDRISQFRHPIPTAKKVEHYVMLVTCADTVD